MFSARLIVLLAAVVSVASLVRGESPVRVEQAFGALHFSNPLYLAHPPDGTDRLFVVEQGGRVVWFDNRNDAAVAHVAIDLSAKVKSGGEEGLLGLAFHPRFKENGQVFLHYTAKPGQVTTLSRFKMDAQGGVIDPASEQVVFTLRQPYANHNGGMIGFAPGSPDGFLYIALGDGGAGGDPHNNGQNKSTLLGKILRIDVDHKDPGLQYAIPRDNPFAHDDRARGEVWAYGLRNPWRFSFDRKTGDLWAGDVGQDRWEEIDVIVKGGNYGWRLREGRHDYAAVIKSRDGLIEPVVEHGHDQARSIIGGYVYRGKKVPVLQGAYLYGDFVTGLIWGLRYAPRQPEKPAEEQYLAHVPALASFGEDRDGEVYVVSLGGWIYRFVGK